MSQVTCRRLVYILIDDPSKDEFLCCWEIDGEQQLIWMPGREVPAVPKREYLKRVSEWNAEAIKAAEAVQLPLRVARYANLEDVTGVVPTPNLIQKEQSVQTAPAEVCDTGVQTDAPGSGSADDDPSDRLSKARQEFKTLAEKTIRISDRSAQRAQRIRDLEMQIKKLVLVNKEYERRLNKEGAPDNSPEDPLSSPEKPSSATSKQASPERIPTPAPEPAPAPAPAPEPAPAPAPDNQEQPSKRKLVANAKGHQFIGGFPLYAWDVYQFLDVEPTASDDYVVSRLRAANKVFHSDHLRNCDLNNRVKLEDFSDLTASLILLLKNFCKLRARYDDALRNFGRFTKPHAGLATSLAAWQKFVEKPELGFNMTQTTPVQTYRCGAHPSRTRIPVRLAVTPDHAFLRPDSPGRSSAPARSCPVNIPNVEAFWETPDTSQIMRKRAADLEKNSKLKNDAVRRAAAEFAAGLRPDW